MAGGRRKRERRGRGRGGSSLTGPPIVDVHVDAPVAPAAPPAVNAPVGPAEPPAVDAPVAPVAPADNTSNVPVGPPIEIVPADEAPDPALGPDWRPSFADVAEARSLLKEAIAIGEGITLGFYRWGTVLRELMKPRRHRALGCATYDELADAHPIPHHTQGKRLIAIAARLDEATARLLGMDKSYALLRYAEALRPGSDPRALLAENPRVKGLTVHVREASASELELATRLILHGETTPTLTDEESRRTRGSARRLRAKLRRLELGDVDIRVHRSRHELQVWVKLDREEADALIDLLPARPR